MTSGDSGTWLISSSVFIYQNKKNLDVSYGSHLLTDVSMTLLDFFGILS